MVTIPKGTNLLSRIGKLKLKGTHKGIQQNSQLRLRKPLANATSWAVKKSEERVVAGCSAVIVRFSIHFASIRSYVTIDRAFWDEFGRIIAPKLRITVGGPNGRTK